MLVSNSPRSAACTLARTVSVALPALALALTGCSRDELAPDCFLIEDGQCKIPDPGAGEVGSDCQNFPEGAVGATYSYQPSFSGGSGVYQDWSATNLPPGLTIDAGSGLISGVPEEANVYMGITISAFDVGKGEEISAECGPLTVNPRLNSNMVMLEDYHCIPSTASKDEMLALLEGGDGTEITCNPLNTGGGGTCPLGDGNGRLPNGISFDADSCTHSGTVNENRRGTWVWMVEIEQSDYTTRVPFCATNAIDTYHDINLTANAVADDDLRPGLFEYNAESDLSFGGGSYMWQIDDPNCPGPDCNNFGFRFNVTCSPFDAVAPWMITLSPSSGTETGMMHEMSASGPAPGDSWAIRPFVASFEMSYCTSSDGAFCDVDNPDTFEQNAQTKYHFDVVGFPTLAP